MKTTKLNMEKACSIFTLYSGETDPCKFKPVLETAAEAVGSWLKNPCDINENKVIFYIVALANLRYNQLKLCQDLTARTFAGTIGSSTNTAPALAHALEREYYKEAAEYFKDDAFTFSAI
jgi:hypothetical protein